jgi:hypothetical protein
VALTFVIAGLQQTIDAPVRLALEALAAAAETRVAEAERWRPAMDRRVRRRGPVWEAA